MTVDRDRVFPLNSETSEGEGDIFYWMTREQRLEENWALEYVAQWASSRDRGFKIVFLLPPEQEKEDRAYRFMAGGLLEMADRARERGVNLYFLDNVDRQTFFGEMAARGLMAGLVCDFHPLREFRREREETALSLKVPVREVDGHNVVPCRYVSQKQEFAAHTLRRKIEPQLTRFLGEFPGKTAVGSLRGRGDSEPLGPYSGAILSREELSRRAGGSEDLLVKPGYAAGMERLYDFMNRKWDSYGEDRNNPTVDGQTGLSPYLHFGQIAPQTVAWEGARRGGITSLKGGFLDEVIVRRELSDNFCYYNSSYDSYNGFPPWAKLTLEKHERDRRDYVYDLSSLEEGATHDDLWNAAQKQLTRTGRMHGYMRMYWAKKILEWSPDPGTAMERAVLLNDRYALDGRDPNGYAGCAWSIGGVHDRAWGERPVFGKIRYMNERGCRRKFPVKEYIRENLSHGRENTGGHKQLSLGESGPF
ncbi:MAG: deoxyribodipyrimidine photo-lyase [Spirochaetales bacterium]|nr:deoxyribodipyrimidine photo-lyase [Spirochaetales bacterium]